jgi:hypothetical protein
VTDDIARLVDPDPVIAQALHLRLEQGRHLSFLPGQACRLDELLGKLDHLPMVSLNTIPDICNIHSKPPPQSLSDM